MDKTNFFNIIVLIYQILPVLSTYDFYILTVGQFHT